MATIKKGVLFLIDAFNMKRFNRETYHIYRENSRIYGQLEEHNIYMCEDREAQKHINNLKL